MALDKMISIVDSAALSLTFTGIANGIRGVTGETASITDQQMSGKIAAIGTEVASQADLISQIKTALDGKAAGGATTCEVTLIVEGVTKWTKLYEVNSMVDIEMDYETIWRAESPFPIYGDNASTSMVGFYYPSDGSYTCNASSKFCAYVGCADSMTITIIDDM